MAKKRQKVKLELTRRDFLVMAGTAAGTAVFAQAVTTGPLSPFATLRQRQVAGVEGQDGPNAGKRWGMVISLDRCIGCEYCPRACNATNDVNPDKPWNIVAGEKTSAGRTFFFSRPCLHCQE